jgi:hypothetical protein
MASAMGTSADNGHGPASPKVFAPLFSKSGRFPLSEEPAWSLIDPK